MNSVVVLCCCVVVLIFSYFGRLRIQEMEEVHYKRKGERYRGQYPNPILSRIPTTKQRGEYWVFYNLFVSKKSFGPYESVTYTTQCDFTFLDNLQPLLERWKGPISIALYAPGDDFQRTIESIHYLRDCTTDLIGEFVTFHVFFKADNLPEKIQNLKKTIDSIYNCDIMPSFKSIKSHETFKALNNLTYPINVARNIAKESSETNFILVSDIELYPSADIVEQFMEMVNRTQVMISNENPIVFPLNVFEVEEDAEIPATKTELLELLKKKRAIPFHQKLCRDCHNSPNYLEWIFTKETKGFHIFHVGKRTGRFLYWEPIYIGTKSDPNYDERLTWEGKRDKMTQGFVLCAKNYDMMILDNAFLVHKPGIKVYEYDPNREGHMNKTDALIKNVISKEIKILFGYKKRCVVM